jgi:hypothetical protein
VSQDGARIFVKLNIECFDAWRLLEVASEKFAELGARVWYELGCHVRSESENVSLDLHQEGNVRELMAICEYIYSRMTCQFETGLLAIPKPIRVIEWP